MSVYTGDQPYIFISYAHADSETVVPAIERLQGAGFRVWYDKGIEAGTEWPQYIAEHLAGAGCVMVFMSRRAADSHNCRSEINLASELKKDMLVIYLEDFELPLGLRLQLNLSQAMYRTRLSSDELFYTELERARILRPYCSGEPQELPVEPAASPVPVRKKKKPLPLILGLGAAVIFLGLMAMRLLPGDPPAETDPPSQQAETEQSSDLTEQQAELPVITDYETFYVMLLAANEKLGCDTLWDPTTLIDNMKIDQDDGDTWVDYYSNGFTTEDVNLHIAFRNEGEEIMAMLNTFRKEDAATAYEILNCISSAVNGYYITDFVDCLANDDRIMWSQLPDGPRSIWNDVIGKGERVFDLVDEGTEVVTEYKTMHLDDMYIYVERRTRTYNGEEYYDFTVLYESKEAYENR